jgi:hypothetical protein
MIDQQLFPYEKEALLHYQSMATRESNYVLVYQTHPVEDIPQV